MMAKQFRFGPKSVARARMVDVRDVARSGPGLVAQRQKKTKSETQPLGFNSACSRELVSHHVTWFRASNPSSFSKASHLLAPLKQSIATANRR